MGAYFRRQEALAAIAQVVGGATAGDAETETVDFKEEADTITNTGSRASIPPRHEPAAAALAIEVACMANSDHGGMLIVGINDKAAGLPALVGTHLDTDWLRRRIHALTQPNYSIDEIEVIHEQGVRLYLLNVPPALTEVRSAGKLRAREGTDCVELSGDRAREFLEKRRGYDWTAERSWLRLSQADPAALRSAHRRYEAEHGRAAPSDTELARRMGILYDEDEDPELSRAGALLLCAYEPRIEQLQVMLTVVEGRPSARSVRGAAPILPLYDAAWEMLDQFAFPTAPTIIGDQRGVLRVIPERALREALANAIMHRDYRHERATIVAVATGQPADTFKVRSPGGFPAGVPADRLIAAPSRPRNLALAEACRILGLAEGEGIGVDTMYDVMLRDGHPPPAIEEDAGDVVVVLHGGAPDLAVRQFFDDLAKRDDKLKENVRATIAITELLTATPLKPERLARIAQCTNDEALQELAKLEAVGAVVRLLNRSRSFRLSDHAGLQLQQRIAYPRRRKLEEHWQLVDAYLDVKPEIGQKDAATLLKVSENGASRLLGDMRRQGWIKPAENSRGAGVRYIRAS